MTSRALISLLTMLLLVLSYLACSSPPAKQSKSRRISTGNDAITQEQNSQDQSSDVNTDTVPDDEKADEEEDKGEELPLAGNLNVQWIHGSPNCANDQNPAIQVHKYNDNLYILRQNKCLNFEAPFMYLLFGQQKAILLDTGATNNANTFPLRTTVEGIISERLANLGIARNQYELVVAHTHAHGDHRAADNQFANQPNTVVVGTSVNNVRDFFAFADWPNDQPSYDLGGRVLDIIGIPGHESSSIAIYDRSSGLLFTGDTLYPGRLYVADWESFRQSIQRLVQFTSDKTVTHILGAHIEMSNQAGVDYQIGSTYQPEEHVLQLALTHLQELNTTLIDAGANPRRIVRNSYIVFPTN